MASFDVVNKVDMQEMDNAVNNTRKALMNRYDFRGSKTEITLDKKAGKLTVVSEDDMKVMAVQEAMSVHLVKRKIDTKAVIWGEPQPAGGAMRRSEATIAQGIEVDTARKIVKLIKEMKLKVQAQIQDQQVRVTGAKLDDLQAVIQMLKTAKIDIPLQFENMKR